MNHSDMPLLFYFLPMFTQQQKGQLLHFMTSGCCCFFSQRLPSKNHHPHDFFHYGDFGAVPSLPIIQAQGQRRGLQYRRQRPWPAGSGGYTGGTAAKASGVNRKGAENGHCRSNMYRSRGVYCTIHMNFIIIVRFYHYMCYYVCLLFFYLFVDLFIYWPIYLLVLSICLFVYVFTILCI